MALHHRDTVPDVRYIYIDFHAEYAKAFSNVMGGALKLS